MLVCHMTCTRSQPCCRVAANNGVSMIAQMKWTFKLLCTEFLSLLFSYVSLSFMVHSDSGSTDWLDTFRMDWNLSNTIYLGGQPPFTSINPSFFWVTTHTPLSPFDVRVWCPLSRMHGQRRRVDLTAISSFLEVHIYLDLLTEASRI